MLLETGQLSIPDELRVLLKWLHRTAAEPSDQSIRNGTQVNLFMIEKYKIIRTFLRVLSAEITNRIGPGWRFEGVWSNSLNPGGFHVEHIHPKGWVSGVCYIDIPDNTSGMFSANAGSMRRVVIPDIGKFVLFNSALPHEVSVYSGPRPRLSIAFDIARKA